MPKNISRREFIKTTAGTVALGIGLTAIAPAKVIGSNNTIPKRPLGSTGLDVTILGLGCVAIGYGPHSIEEGAEIVEACIDAGINYIDCASSYGNGEEKVGRVMQRRRKEVVLATKMLERSNEDAWREINRSLERLKTDHVDLLQIHSINRMEELDRITRNDGSLTAAIRAKDEGMCKHIGITGHTRPSVIQEALNRYPFATTLVPLSSTDRLINDFVETLIPLARERGFGVVAMIQKIYKPNIILLNTGGGPFTQDTSAAALAIKKYFKPDVIIPMHYATFPVLSSQDEVAKAFRGDKRVVVLQPGETKKF